MCVGEIPAAERLGPSVLIASGRLPDAVLGEVEETIYVADDEEDEEPGPVRVGLYKD